MKKHLLSLMVMCLAFICATPASAAITKQYGWFESAAIEWDAISGATDYNVYVKPVGGTYTKIDKELVRKYADFYRADALGLKAGNYQMKVVPVISGSEDNGASLESEVLTVTAHDRSGFAHVGMPGGIGAYKNDGTLKDGARIIYVTAKTAKTVKCNVITDADTEYTGLQAILAAFEKGKETRPLDIRIIGTIKAADVDYFESSAEGIQVKGKSGSTDMNITIEGVGFDATTHGFGFLIRNAKSVELRNFANMICKDDAVSLDTDNHNVWVHNMDFFYGGTGGDSDQAKGDGTVDIKGKSSHITISYNHFYDNGKCSLGGMKGETTDCWMTYHHNWFDHSDSRHPRIRTAFYHCYNNYYDGNSKYAVGVTSGGSAFVEANYFRNVKYPMLSSKQGTDAEGDGTFSGEPGGVNKAFNNVIINPRKIQYWSADVQSTGIWDAVLVENRADAVSATAFTGGTGYNTTADNAARSQYIENKMNDPEDIPSIVRGELGAGRMEHGDFTWTFNNSLQDENYDVISDLKSTLVNYESTVKSFADGSAISDRTPATSTVNGGDGKGLDQEANDAYVPSWAGGGGAIATGKQVIGENDDWFWFNEENQAQVNAYMVDGGEDNPNTISSTGTFNPTRAITHSTGVSCSDYIGSFLIPAGKTFTMYYAGTMSSIAFYTSGNGSQKWTLEKSADGNTWTQIGTIEAKSSGAHPTVGATFDDSEGIKYVRLTNNASGGRDIQAVKVYTPVGASDLTAVVKDISLTVGNTGRIMKDDEYTTSSTGAITFKSSAPKIVTVDNEGNITGVSEGTAKITLTQAADDNYNSGTLTFNITVNDNRLESDLALNSDAEITVEKGATAQINATCSNALTYTSGAPSIATVDENGKITAVGYGTTTITISDPGCTTNKPGTKTVTVNVPDNRTESNLKVENDELTVDRNATVQIKVTKHDGTLTYRSVDEEIATVDADGVVTGLLAGEATIVVSDAGSETAKAGSVNVTVNVNDTRAESQLAITSGTNVDIDMAVSRTATITTEGAAGTLTYDVDDESIISVSADGVITAIKGGTTTITVFDAGNNSFKPGSAVITVNVTAIPPADPVTWDTGDASTLKEGTSVKSGGQAVFISTDGTGLELIYYGGSSCTIDKKNGISYIKMGGSSQYSSNQLSTRYFELPALSGSGTLTVSYAATAADIKVTNSKAKDATALATITPSATSVRLDNLDNEVLYLSVPNQKAYITGVTWTPDLDSRESSTFELTSDNEVAIDVNGTSEITTEHAAGTVTYTSDKPSIATVDANGVITGVADGVATITIKDAGSETVKGKTISVTVTVGTGEEGGQGGDDPVTGGDVTLEYGNIPAGYAVDNSNSVSLFTYSDVWTANEKMFSVASGQHTITLPAGVNVTKIVMYAVNDNNTANKGKITEIAGQTLDVNLPSRKGAAVTATVDNVAITGSFTFTVTYKSGVKFVLTTSSSTPTGIDGISADDDFWSTGEKVFDISGRQVFAPQKGQIYIKNGKKFIKK